jgi:hypothetical protein
MCLVDSARNRALLLSMQDLAALFIVAITRYLDHRPSEVGSAVFDKVTDLSALAPL